MVDSIRDILSCKSTWMVLCETALKDDKITMDEFLLIKKFTQDIDDYVNALEEALEDNIITEEEEKYLMDLRAKMMQAAIETANEDRVISPDEFELLHVINDFISLAGKISGS